MADTWWIVLCSILIVLIVSWLLYCRWLHTHHSSWKFFIAKQLLSCYTCCNKCPCCSNSSYDSSSSKISPKLFLLDKVFRDYIKQDFVNKSMDKASDLMVQTRESRDGFLDYSIPPVKNAQSMIITTDVICDTEVLWINKNSINMQNGLIISFHGGAYVSGCAKSCFPYLFPLCENTKMAGLTVEYGLAPENPLPFAIDQSLNILKYLIEKLNINPKKISLIGDSAGGSLVMLLMQKIQKECKNYMPACAIAMSSWNVPTEGESYSTNSEKDALLDQSALAIWGQMAAGNVDINGKTTNKNANLNDATFDYLSDDASFEGFPPIMLTFSEWECVSDDTLGIKRKWDEEKVKSELQLVMTPQCGIHVLEDFQGYGIVEATRLIDKESHFILKHIATS